MAHERAASSCIVRRIAPYLVESLATDIEKGILSRGGICVTTAACDSQPARATETRGMALFLISATAAAKTELTNDNFDELVFGTGKSAFIKFQAPW